MIPSRIPSQHEKSYYGVGGKGANARNGMQGVNSRDGERGMETDEGDKASRAGEEAKGVDAEAGGDQGSTKLVVS